MHMDFQNIINTLGEGVLVVDKAGNIQYFNDAYGRFIGYDLEDVKGMQLTDIRPGALMPQTIAREESITCALRSENGEDYFASIYPVYENGALIGGVSIVTLFEHAQYFAATLESLKQKEQHLKNVMSVSNGTHYSFDDIICGSDITAECIESAKRIAHSDSYILIQGESGCGKEVFAQSIHNESSRKNHPFVAINCAAMSRELLESELFGYMPGAFTGAKKDGRAGLFEAADHGTLFLDEISEMDLSLQAKLLRAVQEKKIRRIGGTKEIPIDVHIISACNVDLQKYIKEKKFRPDLYYRLAVIPITIPPLRERRGDIEPLIRYRLKKVSIQMKRIIDISPEALSILKAYSWPGNIRELNNVIEYSALMCQGGAITPKDLPNSLQSAEDPEENSQPLSTRVKDFERREIQRALDKYGSSVEGKKAAAAHLGISLASLYNKLGR